MVIMLNQCCCGCTLQTGTIIIGVLNILGGLANLITGIATAVVGNTFDAETQKVFIGVGAVVAIVGGILLLVAICLVIGATKENPTLLVPWMVYVIISIVANTTLYIVYAAEYFAMHYAVNGAGNIIGALIYLSLQTYFLLVVYSLYRELKGSTAQPKFRA